MAKCKVCRENDAELLTRWERIRFWLFERINHVFFPDDFDDMKSGKYTQGYSDGYVAGTEREHKSQAEMAKLYGL